MYGILKWMNIIFAVDNIKVFKSPPESNIIFAVDDIKVFKSPPIHSIQSSQLVQKINS